MENGRGVKRLGGRRKEGRVGPGRCDGKDQVLVRVGEDGEGVQETSTSKETNFTKRTKIGTPSERVKEVDKRVYSRRVTPERKMERILMCG